MDILAGFGIGTLAFTTLICSAFCEKRWFKVTISLVVAVLIAFLVYETWI